MVGINIQAPWSHLLLQQVKSVETRSYPLPKKYEGVELALIETPGKYRNFKAKIIGTITFSHSFRYKDQLQWYMDYNRHRVPSNDPLFAWNDNKPKYGWVVSNIKVFNRTIDPPKRRGIIFTKDCNILEKNNDRSRVA